METTELLEEFANYIDEFNECEFEYFIQKQKRLYAIALVMEKVGCSFQEAASIVHQLLSRWNDIDKVIERFCQSSRQQLLDTYFNYELKEEFLIESS